MTTSTMTRERAIEIARQAAEHKKPSYYAEPFEPHEWVVDAILNAAHLAVHERFNATVLNDLINAWIDCPLEGQVPKGFGEPLQNLLNAVGAFIGRDEMLKDPEVMRRGVLASARCRVAWLIDQLEMATKHKLDDESKRIAVELAHARVELGELEV